MAKKEAKKVASKKEVSKKAPAKGKAPVKEAPKKEKSVVGVDALVAEVVAETGLVAKQVEATIRATFNAIMNINAEGNDIQIVGFGNFENRHRNAKKGRNPQTGEEIEIAESDFPALKVGATYKKRVKEGQPERKEPKVKVVEEAEVETQEEVEAPKQDKKASKKDKSAKSSKKNKKGSKRSK